MGIDDTHIWWRSAIMTKFGVRVPTGLIWLCNITLLIITWYVSYSGVVYMANGSNLFQICLSCRIVFEISDMKSPTSVLVSIAYLTLVSRGRKVLNSIVGSPRIT